MCAMRSKQNLFCAQEKRGYSLVISNLEIGRMSNLSNTGVVVSVRGSVVDIRFDGDLPPIHSVLRAGQEERIIIEVLGVCRT